MPVFWVLPLAQISPELAQRLSPEGVLAVVLVLSFLQTGTQIATSLINAFVTKRGRGGSVDSNEILQAIRQLSKAVGELAMVSSKLLEGQEHTEVSIASLGSQLQGVRDTITTVNTRLEVLMLGRTNR